MASCVRRQFCFFHSPEFLSFGAHVLPIASCGSSEHAQQRFAEVGCLSHHLRPPLASTMASYPVCAGLAVFFSLVANPHPMARVPGHEIELLRYF